MFDISWAMQLVSQDYIVLGCFGRTLEKLWSISGFLQRKVNTFDTLRFIYSISSGVQY